jgi:endonuclease YncB( thermonuclease family)
MLRICSAFVFIFLLCLPAQGASFSGTARVIDGDTLDIGDRRVRIFGIDAPERAQTCTRAPAREWACGAWAEAEMKRRFGGRALTCTELDRDRYGRTVARCEDASGDDVARVLTEAGAAFAYRRYSHDYVEAEGRARAEAAGVWAGSAIRPAEFRAQFKSTVTARRTGCMIKGNISNSGKIFHSPGQFDYDRTKINPARGERWFCSTSEARAAGWRPARR